MYDNFPAQSAHAADCRSKSEVVDSRLPNDEQTNMGVRSIDVSYPIGASFVRRLVLLRQMQGARFYCFELGT